MTVQSDELCAVQLSYMLYEFHLSLLGLTILGVNGRIGDGLSGLHLLRMVLI